MICAEAACVPQEGEDLLLLDADGRIPSVKRRVAAENQHRQRRILSCEVRMKGSLQIEQTAKREVPAGVNFRAIELDHKETPLGEILDAFPTSLAVCKIDERRFRRVGDDILHAPRDLIEPFPQLG